ncbi:DUF4237 domain-containing protein [Lentzea tibetensis]|uniref:DUF4237 domain-containing protein n=1 Tax=Lentzea tibetensis TaxID=2591470 RepID=A0A563EMA4_9PSEU|nr:TNT domain-containing protein [Lentzea tibetensis]TWP48308.1 DUF4237 domain-containing protein [Lentzea tibetensis]
MGIELPAELADVASRAGVQWPQADEDAMRASATAWRDTGDKIKTLSTDTDGSAGRAMESMKGATGDAARGHWAKMVAPDGQFNQAARGCHAAADRLDHAAQQVGQAKVEIVRELVTLAKNNDAANQAASAGHPTALLGLDTAVRGTAANVANLSNTLSSAVRLDSGVDMGQASPPVNTSPGAHGPGGGSPGGLLAPVAQVVAPVTQVVAPVVAPVTDTVAPVVAPVADAVRPVAQVAAPVVAPVADAVPGVHPVVDPVVGKPDHAPGADGRGPDSAPGRDQGGIVPQVVDKLGAAVQPVVDAVPGVGDGPSRGHGDTNILPSVVDRLGDAGPVGDAVPGVGEGRQSLSGTLIPPVAEGTTAASAAALLDRPLLTPEAAPAAGPQAPAAATPQAPAAQGGPGLNAPSLGNAPTMGGPAAAPAAAAGAVGGVVGQAQGSAAQAGQAAQQATGRAADAAAKTADQAKQAVPGTGSGGPSSGTPGAKTDAKAAAAGAHVDAKLGDGQPGAGKGAVVDAKGAVAHAAAGIDGSGGKTDAKGVGANAAAQGSAVTDPKVDPKADPKADLKADGAGAHRSTAEFGVVAQDLGAASPLSHLIPTDHERQEAIAAALGNPVQQVQSASALGTWFLALVYPLGQVPKLSRRPVRQLPPPPEEVDFAAGQRFAPQDHPESGLVDTSFADRPEQTEGLAQEHPAVQALLDGYDPLGGAHEHDWERRFLVRAEPVEYAWPPAELFPEGGYEEGRPEVLDEGAVLDRFGSAEGRVLSQAGTPFAQRSLPPHALDEGYHQYKVLRALPVWRTVSAPWFGQPGGGARYRTTYPVADLVALGYLMEITA